jgi:hypothetical protein
MIKKSTALLLMITSLHIGLSLWAGIFYYTKENIQHFTHIADLGFRGSLFLVFICKVLSETLKNKTNNEESILFNKYDVIELFVIYIGITLIIGKVLTLFLR